MRYKFSNRISWQEMKDYVYVINEEANKIYFLRGMSKRVWLLIDGVQVGTFEDIYRELKSDVREEKLRVFLTELVQKGILDGC